MSQQAVAVLGPRRRGIDPGAITATWAKKQLRKYFHGRVLRGAHEGAILSRAIKVLRGAPKSGLEGLLLAGVEPVRLFDTLKGIASRRDELSPWQAMERLLALREPAEGRRSLLPSN